MAVTTERKCSCRGKNPTCQLCSGEGTYAVKACVLCDGRGKIAGRACRDCRGTGEALRVDDDPFDEVVSEL